MPQFPIYLDNNATTPCDPRVVEAMLPYFTNQFGNAASRSHSFGWAAEEAVEMAREQVARLIGAEPKEMVFTSGATEADNLAIKGMFEMYAGKGNHLITVKTEHNAVLDTCKHIERLGGETTYLDVKADGLVDLKELGNAIKPTTILIAVMYANNETGVTQHIKQISAISKKHNIIFFSDAVQAIGKIPVNVLEDGIDLMAITAHKIYGPKGIGALYVRRKNPRIKLTAQMDGGGHEKGMRSGTLNVPAIVGFGKACELARLEMEKESQQINHLRNKLEAALLDVGATINGNTQHRLPGVANLSFSNIEAEGLMMRLNKYIAASSGSACTSASLEPSHVLKAMGLSDEQAFSTVRFGLGRFTKDDEIDFAIGAIKDAVVRSKELQGI